MPCIRSAPAGLTVLLYLGRFAEFAEEHGLRDALCYAGLARACALAVEGEGEAALEALTAVEALARSSSLALPPWFRDRAERVVRESVDPTRWQIARDAARSLTPSQAETVLCA